MKRSFKIIIALLLCTTQVNGQLPIDSLQYVIEREVANKRSIGITAGVIDLNKKQVISAGKVGEKNNNLPDGNTVYEIGSITKLFTSILLADMVIKRKLNLDDPISKFLSASVKAPTRNGKEITLRNLATHTSGLPDLPSNLIMKGNPFAAYTVKEMYDFLSNYTLNRDIGSKYEYSNYGAALLGHILTRVGGHDYETLVKQTICGPLKMNNTGITITSKQRIKSATGYDKFGKTVSSYLDFDAFEAAAAIRSTVNDLLIFAAANLGLKKSNLDSAIKLSHTIHDSTGMANIDVALGWHTLNRYGTQILWHNGQTAGFKSFIGLDKDKKRGIVVLSNGGNTIDDIALHALNTNYKLQSFKYPWVVKDTISKTVNNKGADVAVQLYYTVKKAQKPNYIFNELQLASVATELMQAKKTKEAIAILKLNTEEYPKSRRVFNSLGDAYTVDGNGKLAIEAYEKSIELNAENAKGIENLRKLKGE